LQILLSNKDHPNISGFFIFPFTFSKTSSTKRSREVNCWERSSKLQRVVEEKKAKPATKRDSSQVAAVAAAMHKLFPLGKIKKTFRLSPLM